MNTLLTDPPLDRATTGPRSVTWDDLSDEVLLLEVRGGDAAAYAEIYRRYEPEARRFAASLVSPDLVDDVVAESFAKMLGALRRGKGPVDFPVRYLMVVVRTTATTLRQRQARLPVASDEEAIVEAFDETLPLLSDDDLVIAFESLPERWRQVIVWSTLEERSPAEIGSRLGLSVGAVASLSFRARQGLREAYLARRAVA